MSILSSLSSSHSINHDHHGEHRDIMAKAITHPSSRSSNDTKSINLEHSCNGLHPHLNLEPKVTRAAMGQLQETHQQSSNHLSTPPDSANTKLNMAFEEQLRRNCGSLSPKSYLDSPLSSISICAGNENHDTCHSENNNESCDHEQKSPGYIVLDHKKVPQVESRSKLTKLLLKVALNWPLLHAVISEKDSRRIFYFMSLNFCFMIVQAFYGYLTDSLGLISDSIHMFFDCLALGVGLFAAIASKWPPSPKFPFGFGKIESLSGFGNGVFLVLISIEIMTEAAERLVERQETKRLGELFTVSSLGLAVNLIGMACFDHHGHAGQCCGGGHNHGHSHSHSLSNSITPHVHQKPHSYSCQVQEEDKEILLDKANTNSKSAQPKSLAAESAAIYHQPSSHSHDDDNMHGIFLHVLADTMGSAAVMLSTVLIYLTGFNGWDPIASFIIAALIFSSSIPLIKSCAKKLLLTLPDDKEYTLRDILASISELRGVSSYYAPRFWLVDLKTESGSQMINGVIHIIATRGSDVDELRKRVQEFLQTHNLDVVVQIERDNDFKCWCSDLKGKDWSTMNKNMGARA